MEEKILLAEGTAQAKSRILITLTGLVLGEDAQLRGPRRVDPKKGKKGSVWKTRWPSLHVTLLEFPDLFWEVGASGQAWWEKLDMVSITGEKGGPERLKR